MNNVSNLNKKLITLNSLDEVRNRQKSLKNK